MASEVEPREPPLVVAVAVPRPRPGLFEATILTIVYWILLIGSALMLIGTAMLIVVFQHGPDALTSPPDAEPGTIAVIPKPLQAVVAWSFPCGYAVGFLFTLLAFRVVGGPGWTREIGLRRVPGLPLLLGLIALPGFVVISDLVGTGLYRVFGMEDLAAEQAAALKELFEPFHWSFAVFAVGIGPGVVEELWCRGFLGRGLIGRYGAIRGIALTSAFFGLLHAYPPPYVLVTALMGVGLHFAYYTSRSLWVPIAMHLANNSLAVLLAMGVIPAASYEAAITERPVMLGGLALALLISAGLALWSVRGQTTGTHVHSGVMVPLIESGTIIHGRASRLWTGLAFGLCIVLIGAIAA